MRFSLKIKVNKKSNIRNFHYFIIFRRVWLVEDPLPLPGFEASVKLMDIAQETSTGSVESAKHPIILIYMQQN